MGIPELYLKIEEFQNRQRAELLARSTCKNGCSRCCHTDISVFAVEANPIREWFKGLDSAKKETLSARWNEPRQPGACAFLRNDSCTIYEARPLICRTQGLAMRFQGEKEGLVQTLIDICPLNDSMLEIIQENEVLNLDLLNRILATLEQQDAQGTPRTRTRLADLQGELKNLTDKE